MVDDNKDDLSIKGVPVEGIVADELHGHLFQKWKTHLLYANFRRFAVILGIFTSQEGEVLLVLILRFFHV